MKYAVETRLGVMTYIPSFIMIGSDILMLIARINRHTHRAWRSHNPIFIFLRKVSYKTWPEQSVGL
jgi:hypothetical protein